jgi:hypothetical protein
VPLRDRIPASDASTGIHDAERWIIEIIPRPHASGNSAGRRIAILLKIALRQLGLRCVGYRLADAGERSARGMTDDTPDAGKRARIAGAATDEPTEIF